MKDRSLKLWLAACLVGLGAGVGTAGVEAETAPSARVFSFGTNLQGPLDYGTELPFVDLMHTARPWHTKDDGPSSPWDTGAAGDLAYRPDGYPTQVPQKVAGRALGQRVATVWGDTSAWPAGTYVVLYDGTGALTVDQGVSDVSPGDHRLTFRVAQPRNPGTVVQLTIAKSDVRDPVRRIRVLLPGAEATYQTQPFNPRWVERLKGFSSVRFMDWGATNNAGRGLVPEGTLLPWDQRARSDFYTWADGRGVPYETMVQAMNLLGVDGWVCVPHLADADYQRNMAALFHDGVAAPRRLTVEYSNETWNWMFDQAHWLKAHGHPSPTALENRRVNPREYEYDPATTWPETITGNIQDCLDVWTAVWGADAGRLKRVVGLQTGWPDVNRRIATNLRPGSFDALAPSYYFGFSEAGAAALAARGAAATIADVAAQARADRQANEVPWLGEARSLAARLHVPLTFYEGGQHLTPQPFGQEPPYAAALVAIQRDPVMKDLYLEWFRFLTTLKSGPEPLVLMNYSFVGALSARYGSWGLLETVDQDLGRVPAPKYQAVVEAMGW
jgi:hypothetical protein